MQTQKHTPGPWTLGDYTTHKEGATRGIDGRTVEGHQWTSLAEVHESEWRPAEGKANAALIAAAPDLREALLFLAPWTMRDGTPCFCPAGKNEDEPKGDMPTLHSTACEKARAAIAKATVTSSTQEQKRDLPEGVLGTEEPKTFETVGRGIAYHKKNNVTGWFIVDGKVFWCYGNGTWSQTLMKPEDLVNDKGQRDVNIVTE